MKCKMLERERGDMTDWNFSKRSPGQIRRPRCLYMDHTGLGIESRHIHGITVRKIA